MNSGGTVTRNMIEAQSYLVMFLLGILNPPQHVVSVPPSIRSHFIPPTFLTLLSPFPGAGDTVIDKKSMPLRGPKSYR